MATRSERVLIAGACGLVGSYLVRAFGDRAVAPVREELDLCDSAAVVAFSKERDIGFIVNATGAAGRPWREMFEVHAFLARALAEASAQLGAAHVYLSTSRVFNGQQALPYAETDPPDPRDDYSLSKYAGECFAWMAARNNPSYVLRFPMLLGLRPGRPETQLVTRLLERARQGLEVQVADDVFTQVVHAADVAPVLLRLREEGLPSSTYHLAGAEPASLFAIVARLFAALGLPAPLPAKARDFQPAGHLAHNLALAPGQLGALPPWQAAVDRFAGELLGSNP